MLSRSRCNDSTRVIFRYAADGQSRRTAVPGNEGQSLRLNHTDTHMEKTPGKIEVVHSSDILYMQELGVLFGDKNSRVVRAGERNVLDNCMVVWGATGDRSTPTTIINPARDPVRRKKVSAFQHLGHLVEEDEYLGQRVAKRRSDHERPRARRRLAGDPKRSEHHRENTNANESQARGADDHSQGTWAV